MALSLALASCQGGGRATWPEGAALRLGPAAPAAQPEGQARIQLRLGSPRGLQGLVRAWQASDVHSYQVKLSWFDPQNVVYRDFSPPKEAWVPAADGQASFGGLAEGARYLLVAIAWGEPGGSAPSQVLNRQALAHRVIDLALSPDLSPLAVPLDPVAFGVTLRLPSKARRPEEIPSWVQRLEVALYDEAATPARLLYRQGYGVNDPMRLTELRGGRPYGVAVTAIGAAGASTSWLHGWQVPKAEGPAPVLDAELPPWSPPPGTLMVALRPPGGGGQLSFGPSFGWVALPYTHGVAPLDPQTRRLGLSVALPPGVGSLAVGPQGQGPLVGLTDRQAWTKLEGLPLAAGSPVPLGATPGELLATPEGGFWVALPAEGRVQRWGPQGELQASWSTPPEPGPLAYHAPSQVLWAVHPTGVGPVGGRLSPVGPRPGRAAWGPDGALWVPCAGDGSLWRLRPDGSASGPPVAVGGSPVAIAWRDDGRWGWVAATQPNRLLRVAPDGQVLATVGTSTVAPVGLVLDPQGGPWLWGSGNLVGYSP